MKTLNAFLVILPLVLLFSCNQVSEEKTADQPLESESTDLNREVTIDDETMLLGVCTREGLQFPEYKNWFDSTYRAYQLDSSLLDQIKPKMSDLKIQAYIGTWCEDSQREIPALFKVLDYLAFNTDQFQQVCVDRSKEVDPELMFIDTIEYVPTIVFYSNQKEIGRVIEFPYETLEKDISQMLRGQN